MKIMIVGGGNVGYYLTKTLSEEKHHLMIVEANETHCARIATELGSKRVEVTHGDGTDVDCLREAGIFDTDVFIAVTGQDQNNLVACQLAKDYFGVKQTIARVKNPKNIRVFEKLGVDSVISSTARIAGIINQELDWTDINKLFKERSSDVRIRRVTVEQGSQFEGKSLAELGLPGGMILVSVLRENEVIIPGGDTRLHGDDGVIIMGMEADIAQVSERFQSR